MKEINDKNLIQKKKLLKTIGLAGAATLVLAVGVPNVMNAIHRREGAKAIVAELEESNLINKDLEFIHVDPKPPVLLSNGESIPITNIESYLKTIANEAFEDGCSPEKFAVALDNSNVPGVMINAVTGCDKEDIKTTQMQAYYESQIKNVKGRN